MFYKKKKVIEYVSPLDPSSHSYILRKYVRGISPPKGIFGHVCVCGGGWGGGGGWSGRKYIFINFL